MKKSGAGDVLYVVMPAYNEEDNIEQVINAWIKVLRYASADSRLVIADSGSKDETHKILLKLQKKYKQLKILGKTNQYHGPKVIALYKYAIKNGADFIFQTDSDGQTDSNEFKDFWNARHKYDGILGVRRNRGDGKSRAFVERIVCFLLRIFFGVKVPDANAPFRLMRSKMIKKYIDRLPEDYEIPNIVLTAYFAKNEERLLFKDVTFAPRVAGENSINIKKIFKVGAGALKDFLYFRKDMRNERMREKGKCFVAWAKNFFWILGFVVVLIIAATILNAGFEFSWWFVLAIASLIIWLCIKCRKRMMSFACGHKKMMRIIGLLCLILGIVLRFSFLLLQDRMNIRDLLSDTGTHWYGAQQLVDMGEFGQEIGDYESLFPYLFTYTGSLALSMRVFGNSYLAVVILNVFFDIVGAIGLYLLFAKWKKSKDVGLFAVVVWALNPLEIVFCGLPLAIVVVNVLFILAMLGMYGICNSLKNIKKLCFYAVLFGLVLTIGNAYRPFFVIFIIAMVVYLMLRALKDKSVWVASFLCVLIASVIMVVGGVLIRSIHSRFNPYYDGRRSQAGWSTYVGANYETHGKWSSDDRDAFFGPILVEEAGGDVNVGQSIALKNAISRYGGIVSHGRLITHFLNKTRVIFGDVRNAIYDVHNVFGVSKTNGIYNLIQDLNMIFYLITFGLFFLSVFIRLKRRDEYDNGGDDNDYALVLVISFIGFFLAMLLMESMNRYSLPFITLMMVLAVGFVVDKVKTPRIVRCKMQNVL